MSSGFGPAEDFEPDECVGEGSDPFLSRHPTATGDLTLRAFHTPGHASNHLCWLVEEQELLLTGDHVMHGSTVVIRPPDGDLHQYLASLARVRDAAPVIRTLAPGHGRLMDHVPEVIDSLVAHRLGRHEAIAAALTGRGEGTVDELLPQVYGDVTERQLPVARYSLWAHLRALGQEGRAVPVDAAAGRRRTPSRLAGPPPEPRRGMRPGLSRFRRPPVPPLPSTRSMRRAEQPWASTSGDTSSAITRAISSKTAPKLAVSSPG